MDAPPDLHVVASTAAYRQRARELPAGGDVVLEVGCSTGEATRLMLAAGARVVAVDHGAAVVARAREALDGAPGARVELVDARDTDALAALCPAPDLVFVDVGGNALLDNVALVLRLLLRAFVPRAVVVKSAELAALGGMLADVEVPRDHALRPPARRPAGGHTLENLLDLSRSLVPTNRLFAARMLRGRDEPEARARTLELRGDEHPRVRFLASHER